MVIKKQLYFLFLVFVTNAVSAQEIIQPYDFPIKPGSESWQSLKTHKEMVQVCQIPDDTLQKMTTRALLQTCLSYPMLLDVLAFDNLITGFEQTLNGFNGYQALVERPDFAESLVEYYQNIDAAIADTLATDVMKGYFSITLSITELLFGTQHFLNNGLNVDHKKLLKLLLDKLETKENYTDIYMA